MIDSYSSLRIHELLSFVYGLSLNQELVELMSGGNPYTDLMSLQEILAELVIKRLGEEERIKRAELEKLEKNNE